MKEIVIYVWLGLAILFGLVFYFQNKITYKRKLDIFTALQILIMLLLSFTLGCLLHFMFKKEIHIVWVERVIFLILGTLHVWSLYRLTWVKRHLFDWSKDSLELESVFTAAVACLTAISFALSSL